MNINSRVIGSILALAIFIIGTATGLLLSRMPFFHGFLPPPGRHGFHEPGTREIVRFIDKDLQLNEEQEMRLGIILEKQREQMEQLREEMHPRFEAQMRQFDDEIRSILDDRQKQVFNGILEKRRRGMPKFGPPPPFRGEPPEPR